MVFQSTEGLNCAIKQFNDEAKMPFIYLSSKFYHHNFIIN